MIASHDRNFLDACTTRTLFLRPEASMVFNHPYSRARALLAEHDGALASQFDKDRREMRRLRQNAGELRNIGINSGSDLLLRKAKQLGGRADALEQGLQAGHQERSGKIALSNRGTHARVLVSLDHVVVRKPDGERSCSRSPGSWWRRAIASSSWDETGSASPGWSGCCGKR